MHASNLVFKLKEILKTVTNLEEDLLENHGSMTFDDLSKKIGTNRKVLTQTKCTCYNTLIESYMDTNRDEIKAFLTKKSRKNFIL